MYITRKCHVAGSAHMTCSGQVCAKWKVAAFAVLRAAGNGQDVNRRGLGPQSFRYRGGEDDTEGDSRVMTRFVTGKSYHASMVLELNASDDRGIDVVREQIKTFAATKTFSTSNDAKHDLKLIVLDEADAMTSAAQNALRRVMEKYVRNVRFVIICNYVGQIIPALQSRCTRFRFAPLPLACLQERLMHVAQSEGLVVTDGAQQALIRIAAGDMRRVLNVLQAAAAAYQPKPIDEDAIYAVTAAPHPTDMTKILHWLLNEDISEAYTRMKRRGEPSRFSQHSCNIAM